jgi:hypothetical protein
MSRNSSVKYIKSAFSMRLLSSKSLLTVKCSIHTTRIF